MITDTLLKLTKDEALRLECLRLNGTVDGAKNFYDFVRNKRKK